MINNLQISGIHENLNAGVKSYAVKKIGKLDRFLPKRTRESVFVDVKIKAKKRQGTIIHECKVVMQLPKKLITIKKDSVSAKAAIDEVENNLKNQLKKYKDSRARSKFKKRPKLGFQY